MEKVTLDTEAEFSWNFGQHFFVETKQGNFIWSDPDHNGDNTLIRFHGTHKDWLKSEKLPYSRSKGVHTIGRFCGPDVKLPE